MKRKKEILDHVAQATGVGRAEVGKVVDAAFAFVRASVIEGTDVDHPSLGRIRVKTRAAKDGASKTVYRYQPEPAGKGKRAKRAGGPPEAGPTP